MDFFFFFIGNLGNIRTRTKSGIIGNITMYCYNKYITKFQNKLFLNFIRVYYQLLYDFKLSQTGKKISNQILSRKYNSITLFFSFYYKE